MELQAMTHLSQGEISKMRKTFANRMVLYGGLMGEGKGADHHLLKKSMNEDDFMNRMINRPLYFYLYVFSCG